MQHTWTVRSRAVVAALVALFVVGGCSSIRAVSEQRFHPATPGVLTVATTLPATAFWRHDATGAFDGGFEWQLADALADRFGLRLHVIDVPFARLVDGDLGGADMAMAQISITDARAERVDFSVPYHETSAGVLAAHGEELTDLRTARRRTWAVVAGTTEADLVDDVIAPDHAPVVVADDEAAADAVQAGTADAALLDVASALALEAERPELTTIARFVTNEHDGVALPHGSSNVAVVDAALRALEADGMVRSAADRWLTTTHDPNAIPIITAQEQ